MAKTEYGEEEGRWKLLGRYSDRVHELEALGEMENSRLIELVDVAVSETKREWLKEIDAEEC